MGTGQPYMISALRSRRFTITIPASAGTPATIESLVAAVAAAGDVADIATVVGCKIDGLLTSGSNRPAMLVGDSTVSSLQYIAAGEDYNEPTIDEYKKAYVIAAANATIDAVAILYIG